MLERRDPGDPGGEGVAVREVPAAGGPEAGCDAAAQRGTATQVNVLGTAASVEQAVQVADLLGSVSVLDGAFGDVSVDRAISFAVSGTASVRFSSGVLDANALLASDAALIEIVGSGFEVDAGSGFLPVASGALSATSGTLRGALDSGDLFEVDFQQGGGGYTGSIVLVPEPSTAVLLGLGLLALGARSSRRRIVSRNIPIRTQG